MGLKPGHGRRTTQAGTKDMSVDLARVATISIDAQVLPLHSWSMTGFRCGGYSGHLRPGHKTRIRIIIPTVDGPQSFEMIAEIQQRDIESGLISGEFLGLSKSQVERMDAIFARRLSGRRGSL